MWSNGATLFVVDDNDVKIYAYTLSDRSRDDDKNIDLDAANTDPEGLWFDGRVLWVVDDADDKLYVYDLPGAQPENSRASGAPAVTGSLAQGQTLTADTSGITDATDGLAYVYYHYQWIRVDGTTVTELAGETGATYTATADDVTKDIQVRVVFDDHLGYREYPRYSPQVTVLAIPPPEVTGVALTSNPGADDTYAIDDDVEATVAFDKAVDISGAPQLELDFDGTAKAAGCATGTNTTTMVCSYTVLVNDSAPDGVEIAADKLSGGTITATGAATAAGLNHSAVAIDADHKVDGIRPTLVTTGSDAPKTSADGRKVLLKFSERLHSAFRPDFTVSVAGTDATVENASLFVGGEVEITLDSGDAVAPGETVTIALAAGAVEDPAGNGNLALAATAVTNVVAPTVTGVALTSNPGLDNTYSIGNTVSATVTFSAAVDITGAPQLELDFAGTAKAAGCATGTNTTTMVCSYTVLVNDTTVPTFGTPQVTGIAIAANKLTGGTITATGATTAADLDHSAVAIDAGHKVDGIRPTLVTTGSDAPKTSADGTKIILTFSENVSSPLRARIIIKSGTTTLTNTAAAATGTKVEVTLATALTGMSASLTVELSAGAVEDTPGSNGNLALAATTVTNAVASTPTVTEVALTSTPNSGSTYGIGQDIEATVTFSVAVDISGSVRLEMDIGGAAKAVGCETATNTTTTKCTYTVAVGDSDMDGIAIGANKLTGGTIHATGDATETADRDHSAVAADNDHKVDGTRPTLVTSGANAPTTSTTDGTQVILTFSEDISAADHDKITIRSGATTLTTTAASANGPTVEVTLMTALSSTAANVTVALGAGAVEDVAGNGNLARSASGVSNVVGILNLDPSFPSTETGLREVAENNVEGQTVGAPVSATDPDPGDALTYSLSGTDAASFTIDSSGQIRVATGVTLDYEGKKSYRVTVQVSDRLDQDDLEDLSVDDTQRVTITVTNVNEAPVVTGPGTASIKENASAVLATYRATDPEGDKVFWAVSAPANFWISDRGQLHFLSPRSFEVQETYSLIVSASDGTVGGSLNVTVTVENVEEPGVVTITPPRGWEGTTFTADLDDDDGGETGHSWEWERSSNRSSWTSLSTASSASSTYTATTADIGHYLRATVTYTDAGGSNKMASATLTQKIEGLSDRPVSNTAPEFTEDDDDTVGGRTTTRTVAPGTSAGRSVGAPVTATDTDPGDVLTYSLSGADADRFDIDPVTGQIRTKGVLVHDPDTPADNEYTVTVSVHDGFGGSYSPSTPRTPPSR